MNSSNGEGTYKHPQPATALASHQVLADKVGEYLEAQGAITDAARKFPGFVGTEVLCPIAGLQEEWVAIFRLESNDAMKRWLVSPQRAKLTARIEKCLAEPSHMLVLASDDSAEPPVAMVFTHKIAKERVSEYMEWRRKSISAQALYPGYLATEFFQPHGFQDEWVDIVRYDSIGHLNAWMSAKERGPLLEELDKIVESRHEHPVTGLEGWFAVNRGLDAPASGPPSWKQALAVLFALYPTVMALSYLNPLMRGWSMPIQMLIGNVLSCIALTWLVMPRVSQFLWFWLNSSGRDWRREALGLGTIAAGLAMFVVLFKSI
jgi:hypothetical protein